MTSPSSLHTNIQWETLIFRYTNYMYTYKTKSGNLSDSSDYRPIALATIVSKMFESLV